ncbi:HU family DNA-binding protein [Streptosporangium sp. NPDC000239]|uniref:HU family DNA-binding protein n=1 Tax=Streptosporangium sp. NPDC000239 TaxID=3154248 RepID=UPI00331E34E0
MNKRELIYTVSEHTGVTKDVVAQVLGGILDAVQLATATGDKVAITGFGSFEAVHKPARTARNPQNGAEIKVAESWAPRFRPGSDFKDLVKESRSTALAPA